MYSPNAFQPSWIIVFSHVNGEWRKGYKMGISVSAVEFMIIRYLFFTFIINLTQETIEDCVRAHLLLILELGSKAHQIVGILSVCQ